MGPTAARPFAAESFEALFLASPAAMLISTPDEGIVDANPAAARMLGRSRDDLLGKTAADLGVASPALRAEVHESVARGDPRSVDLSLAIAPGVVRYVIAYVSSILLSGERYVLTTMSDVTERNLLVARVLEGDRLAAIGTLASGAAHEINNPLSYVAGNLELLAHELSALESERPAARQAHMVDLVADAREGALRIGAIVRGLQTFARDENERRSLVDPNHVLDLATDMKATELGLRVRLVKVHGSVPAVLANEAQLARALLEILQNAAQALAEGAAGSHAIRVVTRTDDAGRAVITITDTGCGIAPEVLPRIFDPFFTTRALGEGRGLGLSVARNIILGLGGTLDVTSELGRGTEVTISLPAASVESVESKPAPSSRRTPSSASGAAPRRGAVLVVDDDPNVGKLTKRILSKEHDVVVVETAMAALEVLMGDAHFDVILCDLMMPVMSGAQLYEELRRRRPELLGRIVFVSGGAFTSRMQEFLASIENPLLDKPVPPADLRGLVSTYVR